MNIAQNHLRNRIALVTGASRGIGAAVAKRFAAEGAHVVLVARTVGRLVDVDDEIRRGDGNSTLVPLDLLDFPAIDRLGGIIGQRYKRLDVLVGNAAMLGGLYPTGHFPPKTWENVLALNLTANWRLIRACDPLLRNAEAGRAIFVTSAITQRQRPYWAAYTASKAALEALVRTYAAELGKTSVKANLVDPGIVRTAMRAEAMPGENPEHLPAPESITDLFVHLASNRCTRNGETVSA